MVSILGIGLLTAFLGDLASSFGCTIGLKDAVTAISFVALGTSVPGKDVLVSACTKTLILDIIHEELKIGFSYFT